MVCDRLHVRFNPIIVTVAFFNCTPMGRASDNMIGPKAIHFSWLGPELLVCCLAHRGSTVDVFFCSGFSAPRNLHRRVAY